MNLSRLLELIAAAGVIRPEALARQLETTPEMVAAALQVLAQRGYLRAVPAGCQASGCSGCSAGPVCARPAARVWVRARPES